VSARDVIHKVRSVRLVATDDPGYLAAMSEQALAHRRYGPKEEQSATYRVSARVEEAVRAWLAAHVTLLPERVLAADVLYQGARAYARVYLELDAVQGRNGTPTRVYEVKFTSNLNAVRRGFGQVARAVRLLGSRYDRVAGVVVLVPARRSEFDPEDPRVADLSRIGAQDLAGPELPPSPLLVIALGELAPYLTPEDCDLLSAALDEGEANVAAREERAALPADETPSQPERSAPLGATLAFGDDEGGVEDSPFAVLKRWARPGRGARS
jgi:hypothetical protein